MMPNNELPRKDYYAILGVQKTASEEEIKKAFKKLALIKHPDRGGTNEAFQELQEAYEVLGDTIKRYDYDRAQPLVSVCTQNVSVPIFSATSLNRSPLFSRKKPEEKFSFIVFINLRDVGEEDVYKDLDLNKYLHLLKFGFPDPVVSAYGSLLRHSHLYSESEHELFTKKDNYLKGSWKNLRNTTTRYVIELDIPKKEAEPLFPKQVTSLAKHIKTIYTEVITRRENVWNRSREIKDVQQYYEETYPASKRRCTLM